MSRSALIDLTQREDLSRIVGKFDSIINALMDQSKDVVDKKIVETSVEIPEASSIIRLHRSLSEESPIRPPKPKQSKKKKCRRCGSLFVSKQVL